MSLSNSSVNTHWKDLEPVTHYWHIFTMVIHSIIFAFGLIANLFAIVCSFENLKNVKRKTYTYLIINLMAADLIFLVNLPLSIYNSYFGKWMLPKEICYIYGICGGLFGFVSIITLTMISIERYLVIKYPFKALESSNRKTSIGLVLIAWTYGAIICALPFQTPNAYVQEAFLTTCTFDFISRDRRTRVILITMCIVGFIMPLLVMAIFYTLIVRHVMKKSKHLTNKYRKHISTKPSVLGRQLKATPNRKKNSKHREPSNDKIGPTADQASLCTQRGTHGKQTNSFVSETRLALKSFVLVFLFLLIWSPYFTIVLIAQFSQNRSKYITPTMAFVPSLFAKMSLLVNPIVYAFTNQKQVKIFKNKFFKSKNVKKLDMNAKINL
jgi:r-opsin